MMYGGSDHFPVLPLHPSSPPASTNKGPAAKKVDEGKLKKACEDFESIFISQMLKGMRQTIPKSGLLDGGNQQDTYLSLFDQELSKSMAKRGGIGLGAMLYKSMMNGGNHTAALSAGPEDQGPKKITFPE